MNTRTCKVSICHRGFTLIELLVVIAIIALLMSILMPALGRARKQAKGVVCQASLKQWTFVWSMFTTDNGGYFHEGEGGESETSRNRWPVVLKSQYKDLDMRLCPMATKTANDGAMTPFAAWGGKPTFADGTYGSYGFNEWLCNRKEDTPGGHHENYWLNIYSIKQVNRIPVFLDCYWYDVWPFAENEPPQTATDTVGRGTNEMKRVCLNRHSAAVNGAFLDWSVRRIDLKELWTLKWHRYFDTSGPWTMAGGARPEDWPEWMRGFRDY